MPGPLVSVDALCARAGEMLRAAGFVVDVVSMQSEATYYRMPGKAGLLRVASHPKKSKGVAGSVTFIANRTTPGLLRMTDEQLREQVARAIGFYIMKTVEEPKP